MGNPPKMSKEWNCGASKPWKQPDGGSVEPVVALLHHYLNDGLPGKPLIQPMTNWTRYFEHMLEYDDEVCLVPHGAAHPK